ncbi:MAG: polyprenyl synthetase family protein [Deltaproteobacteria bacterium]|nr:polyprenyl synthetase family protein [Deltaproteobacteria bacterium]
MSELLSEYRELVNRELDRRLPAASGDQVPGRIGEAMRYSVLGGGKRVRPIMVLSACRACGADPERALSGACAVELIHAYSLVHDDLPAMDDDAMRRGKPSCHKAFGEANAILVGDALLTLAFDFLATPPESLFQLRAVSELARLAGWWGLVGGQVLDLELGATEAVHSFDELERIHRGKTAALFEASAVIGALLAEADDAVVEKVRRYGIAMGLAFQHIDDALDQEHRQYADQAVERSRHLLADSRAVAEGFGDEGCGLVELVTLLEERLEQATG